MKRTTLLHCPQLFELVWRLEQEVPHMVSETGQVVAVAVTVMVCKSVSKFLQENAHEATGE